MWPHVSTNIICELLPFRIAGIFNLLIGLPNKQRQNDKGGTAKDTEGVKVTVADTVGCIDKHTDTQTDTGKQQLHKADNQFAICYEKCQQM